MKVGHGPLESVERGVGTACREVVVGGKGGGHGVI